jgi:hypothetical protein
VVCLTFCLKATLQEGELFQKWHPKEMSLGKPMISLRRLALYSSPFFLSNASMSVLDRSNNVLLRPLNNLKPYYMVFGRCRILTLLTSFLSLFVLIWTIAIGVKYIRMEGDVVLTGCMDIGGSFRNKVRRDYWVLVSFLKTRSKTLIWSG